MSQKFDAAAATATYLAQLSPAVHAKAQAYTQGGHWLLLWGFLISLLSAFLILRSGVLVRTRLRLEGHRRRPLLASFGVGVVFLLMDWLLNLPWSAYSNWWREKQYGMTSQAFVAWLGEGALSFLISAVFTGLFLVALYGLIRKARRLWWLWAGGLSAGFMVLGMLVAPIYIEPLFNTYTPAPNGEVRNAVVEMAKANGIPSDKIFIYDGSRQSNAYTANVSGLFGSARIAMSDTMFRKGADLAEVRGVVGHEMGHYARGHSLWITGIFSLLAILAFFLVDRFFAPMQRLLSADGVTGIADPAGLPVLAVILAVLGLLGTPILNTVIREIETDADRYSLEHVGEPDGLAKALVKTIEYRAATPGKIEEALFYDHPAVGVRIRRAMDWKAAHPKPQ
ncbi:M48 family metallopeptidase [Caulobacter henricii]|uniref:Peptidase M48 n=1 Tax=Caulobacter henricii TaxID=69395 RepID=A0A0P0P0C2_9CAUL|nr:M48 family metallopeptidase [Caulobacter henricii]ALL13591.1 peptidase M48 [Caulobacter henricii]